MLHRIWEGKKQVFRFCSVYSFLVRDRLESLSFQYKYFKNGFGLIPSKGERDEKWSELLIHDV